MKERCKTFIALILFLVGFSPAWLHAEEQLPLKGFSISGWVFFDYAYLFSSKGPLAEEHGRGWNLFQFRRAYFTLDHKFSENFMFRFRTDADREDSEKARLFLKNLYLEWSHLVPNAKLYIGMISTPAKELSEPVWGYRGVEKTLIDVFKQETGQSIDFSSADVGVGLKGKFGRRWFYDAVFVNGAGYTHPEGDKYKKLAALVGVSPLKGFSIAGYVDVEKQDPEHTNVTLKSDILYKSEEVSLGLEMLQYNDEAKNLKRKGISLFGTLRIGDKAKIIGRYDFFNPVLGKGLGEKDEINFFIFGLDYFPHDFVHVIPNLRLKTYADERNSDFLGYVTFEFKF